MAELEDAAEWARQRGFSKLGLQIPDSRLAEAKRGSVELQRLSCAGNVVVVAGASCCDCCVDEVSAKHAGVDAVVHLGPACFTRTQALPAFNCLDRLSAVSASLSESAAAAASDALYAFDCATVAVLVQPELGSKLLERISKHVRSLHCDDTVRVGGLESQVVEPDSSELEAASNEVYQKANRTFDDAGERSNRVRLGGIAIDMPQGCVGIGSAALVWVGEAASSLLSRIAIEYNSQPLMRVDPSSGDVVKDAKAEVGTQKELMRRLGQVEKLKNASIIGVLVSAPGAAQASGAVDRLRYLSEKRGKSCYTVVTGRPTPEKLANFTEVEAFVQVACWRSALLQLMGDCLQPVLAPFEAELALAGNADFEWDGAYRLSARTDNPNGRHGEQTAEEGDDSSATALIESGEAALSSRAERALKVRDERTEVAEKRRGSSALSAAEHLAFRRTYEGVPREGGEGEQAEEAREGEYGRAAQYAFENKPSSERS